MSETKVRRSRTEMIAETTTKLIAAARRSFAQVGYAVTSMDELCAEVGLTRGALYHHFGGKEGLLEAVVKQIDQEMGAKMDAVWYSTDDRWEGFQLSCQRISALHSTLKSSALCCKMHLPSWGSGYVTSMHKLRLPISLRNCVSLWDRGESARQTRKRWPGCSMVR